MAVRQDVADILDRAADLLEPEGVWTKGISARDQSGRWVHPTSDQAVCWCAIGAISRVRNGQMDPKAFDPLLRAIRKRGGDYGAIGKWNDAPERTQSEVVAKLREAAAALRKARAEPSIDTGGE